MSFDQAYMAQVATGHEMQSFAWNDNELNYLADQMHFNDNSNAYYGVPDDYNNEWHPGDYGYLRPRPTRSTTSSTHPVSLTATTWSACFVLPSTSTTTTSLPSLTQAPLDFTGFVDSLTAA